MVIGVSFYTFLNCYHRVTLEYTLSKNCYHRLEYTLSKKRLLKEISCAKHTQLKNLLFSCLAIESLHLICWKIISIAGCFNYLISSHGFFHCPQKPLLNIFTNKFDNGLQFNSQTRCGLNAKCLRNLKINNTLAMSVMVM